MKRLIFSDLHLHPFSYGASINEEGYNTRLWQQYQAALEMIKDVDEYNIKYAYFCGDLFHQHGNISTQALVIATRIFNSLQIRGVKIRAIAGNHDQYDKSGRIHALEFLPEENIYGLWDDEGIIVSGLSYTNNEEHLKKVIEHTKLDERGMVLLHQGVIGVPLSSGCVLNELLTPNMIPDNVMAFTGHYHFFRKVSPNLTVVGNLAPLNWSDIDQKKGWVIWDDTTNELEQKIQSASPNFISWDSEKDTDLSVVKSNFVRYIQPVKTKEQQEIREKFLKEGALTVEFPTIKLDQKQTKVLLGEKITIENIIKNIDEKEKGRRKEVGVEVREERYETP